MNHFSLLFPTLKKTLAAIAITILILAGLYGCASLGSPQGGPYDIMPPKYVTSIPEPNAINFEGKKVEIIFNELVNLEKASEKVIVTPPQKQLPVIKAIGKKIQVEFLDSMVPNTTYTIDFTDAIVDNNEKNPLENYSFAFSTGGSLDSLIVSGKLLNAENLEPMPNVLIGLHSNLDDSAFTKIPFLRTTKTNDKGLFWIRNVKEGHYRLFALNDKNRDYKFDQPGEEIAFFDSIVVPSFEPAIRMDTIWADSLTVDTIIPVNYNHFIPDNLLCFLFKEKFERQYLSKSERTEHKLTLYFNSPISSEPELKLLNQDQNNDWFIREYKDNRTTINYWITDSLVNQSDTLYIEATYFKSDSLNQLVENTDTLKLFERKIKAPKKNSKDNKIEFLRIESTALSSMDVSDTIRFTFSEPIDNFDKNEIRIQQKVDTIWAGKEFEILQDSLNPLSFYINKFLWDYGVEYKINIDSAAFKSIYGKWNDKLETTSKFKSEEEYGNLTVNILGVGGDGFGELLDNSDKPILKAILKNGKISFLNIKPGKYYLRYIEDSNGNQKWDTGNYKEKQQPENVYYYPKFFEIRKNWDNMQSWNVNDVSVEKQKPLEITKNKPTEKKKKKDNSNYNSTQKSNNENKNMPSNNNQTRF